MKLALVVVYLVRPEDQALLQLHLKRIEQHTRAPYQIHGVAVRLDSACEALLQSHPRVRLHPLPPTPERSSKEHSYYLELLIRAALDEGATHVAALHVDSFPVRDGWEAELAASISPQCPVASIPRDELLDWKPSTACLFFPADYHQRCAPTLLLPAETLASPEYRRYLALHDHMDDSGVGYGFDLYRRGLSWHPLRQTSVSGAEDGFGAIYGDLVYHLGGAVRHGNVAQRKGIRVPGAAALRSVATRALPPVLRRALRGRVAGALVGPLQNSAFDLERRRLLDDPDAHIERLRGGSELPG